MKEFSPQIDVIHKKFGFLRRELDKFCSTKIRIWINNNKMRSNKAPQHQHALNALNQSQQLSEMDDGDDMESSMIDVKRESGRPEDPNGGGDSKRQKVDGESPHPSFRLENFLPLSKTVDQSVGLPDRR